MAVNGQVLFGLGEFGDLYSSTQLSNVLSGMKPIFIHAYTINDVSTFYNIANSKSNQIGTVIVAVIGSFAFVALVGVGVNRSPRRRERCAWMSIRSSVTTSRLGPETYVSSGPKDHLEENVRA
jgi:hypothetical protein